MKSNVISYVLYLILIFVIIDYSFACIFVDDEIARNKNIRCFHPYYHHDLIPDSYSQYTWGQNSYDMHVNSLGFKDFDSRKISLRNDNKNIERLLLIGDSFVEGIGVNQEFSFHYRLQKHFSDSHEILNAGVVSYSPKLMYHKLKFLIEKKRLEFDKVWVFIDLTDVFDEMVYESFIPEYRSISSSEMWTNKLVGYGMNNSFIFNTIYHLVKNTNKRFWLEKSEGKELNKLGNYDRWTYDTQLYEKSLPGQILLENYSTKIVALCQQYNKALSFVIFPRPNQIRNEIDVTEKNVHVSFWEDFCRSNSIELINLWEPFYRDPAEEVIAKYFIPNDMHWNEAGHKFIFDLLSPYIATK